MKKILFVCDGDNFPNGAIEFIKQLNESEPLIVKGLFFEPIDFQELIPVSYIPITAPYVKLKEGEKKLVKKSMQKFIAACQSGNIKYQVDEDGEVDRDLLIKETRFADLMVISEELFCTELTDYQPNIFMKEILQRSECPVMAIPENFKSITRIIVAYDGKKECMLALKQFISVMPALTDLPTEFVYVKNEESDEVPDDGLLKEYVQAHFDSSSVFKLHFDAKKYFATWMELRKNMLLVTGSFGRASLSDLLHSSFAGQTISDHKMPVFIAHHA